MEELREVNGIYISGDAYSADGESRSGSFCSSDLKSFLLCSVTSSLTDDDFKMTKAL